MPVSGTNRSPVFYGWWIAIAAAVGLGLGGPPIFVFSFGIFLKALTAEFHANRAAIAFAFTLHNFASSVASPFAGRLIDRIGIRRVVLPSTALFAILLLGNRFITVSVAGVYLFNICGALIGIGFGQIPYSTAIARWFDRRRGAGIAVMMAGLGVSAALMPSILQRVIAALGWRDAYAIYGAAMLLAALPIVAVLMKDSPSVMGLHPDGAAAPSSDVDAEGRSGMTRREAMRTSTFWVMVAAVVLLGASVHACIIHLVAMLTDYGFTPRTAALASSFAGAGLLAGRVGTGFLLDRFFGPRIAICCSTAAGIGVLLLLVTRGIAGVFLGALLVGLAIGAETDVLAYLTSRYFGLASFGAIYGLAFGAFVMAGGCGAWLMGFGYDQTGSYAVPLIGFLGAIVVAMVLFSRLGPYRYAAREQAVAPSAPYDLSTAAG